MMAWTDVGKDEAVPGARSVTDAASSSRNSGFPPLMWTSLPTVSPSPPASSSVRASSPALASESGSSGTAV